MAKQKQWKEIDLQVPNHDLYLSGALNLIQMSLKGYNRLSVAIIKDKMKKHTRPPTELFALHVYSYADIDDPGDLAALRAPLVTAFYFLRQKHRGIDPQEPRAYSMTYGAQTTGADALTKAQLKQELINVCKIMRRDHTTAAGEVDALLEVMHSGPRPLFWERGGILEQAFDELAQAANIPKLTPKDYIDVEPPWTQCDHPENLKWYEINEQ